MSQAAQIKKELVRFQGQRQVLAREVSGADKTWTQKSMSGLSSYLWAGPIDKTIDQRRPHGPQFPLPFIILRFGDIVPRLFIQSAK